MEKSKYRRWTQEEDNRLKSLYQRRTCYELAIIFERRPEKIVRRAGKLGLKKDKVMFGRGISRSLKRLFREGKLSMKGDKNPNWKGGRTQRFGGIPCGKYMTVHDWLRNNFGKANKCENIECSNISKKYCLAKKKNCSYDKDRNNFMMLCYSCHTKYDKKL